MKIFSGLRGRWLTNTVIVFCILGLLCVAAVSGTFAAYYYSNMRSDMYSRAWQTTEFFSDYIGQNYEDYYQSCVTFAKTFDLRNRMELQFINSDGLLVASSYGDWVERSPSTPEIQEAMRLRSIRTYRGSDPDSGERILAVSAPMVYSNGEVVGVLRYVTSTRLVDRQILLIGALAMAVFLGILGIFLLTSSYFIRSILLPVDEITKKARKIAAGSYGVQIQTKYNDEIALLAETINEMSVKINQNEKMQADFISSLSHELRTPLTAINGWSETLLGNDELDAETMRGVKIISKEARRLTDMVVELLDFTRLQDGRFTLHVEQTDIRGEFEDTVFMYGSRLLQEGIRIEYDDHDLDIPEIPCDPERMRQVFLNILDNAAKHGGEGKRIQASMDMSRDHVIVRIRDFGPGIPEEELPMVKKKFYKGSSKVRGTGIGLAVCDEIVAMHGGQLILENAAGGGTLVTIMLPILQ